MVSFSELTDPQKEAATYTNGDLLVFAGAGTGKTTVLENRYDNLINQGVPKDEILLTSFNNTAVDEIKERISSVDNFDKTYVTTIHSLAMKIVSENTTSTLKPFDDESNEKTRVIENLLKDVIVEGNRRASSHSDLTIQKDLINKNARIIENNLDLIRTRELQPLRKTEELIDNNEFEIETELKGEEQQTLRNFESVLKKTVEKYRKKMRDENRIDFEGMQFRMYKLLEEHTQIRDKYQDRWSYIMVDEAQDLSLIQWKIVKMVSGGDADLALIGDDAQAIYGWRGSNHEFMHEFAEKPGVKTVTLDTSFRSSSQIIEAVNDVSRNLDGDIKQKILKSHKGEQPESQDHPQVSSFDTLKFDESKNIAFKVEQLLSEGYKPDDIAVVSRNTHPVTGTVANHLRQRGIPCVNEKAFPFFDRAEIQYVLSILKAYSNPEDDILVSEAAEEHVNGLGEKKLSKINRETSEDTLYESLSSLKSDDVKGVGDVTSSKANDFIKFLESLRNSDDPFEDITSSRDNWKKSIFNHVSDWDEDRGERVKKLRKMVYNDLEEFSPVEVDRVVEKLDSDSKVTITTAHSAKGREWDVVFIPGLAQGYFPNAKSEDQDEEQRIFYVAISRAREKCFLSYSEEINNRDNLHRSEFLGFVFDDVDYALQHRNWW